MRGSKLRVEKLRVERAGIPHGELCRLARKAMPLMTANARAEAEELIAVLEGSPRAAAAAAFEADMVPVRDAIAEALEGGDMDSLRGLRAMLPHLLAEVNAEPALAEELTAMIGREVVLGMMGSHEDTKARRDEEALRSGNGSWREELHPRGGRGRFVESIARANIQRGKNAMNRVLAEETDVIAAMHRDDVGDIDFVWERIDSRGKGRGIKHILDRRQEEDHAVKSAFSPMETLGKLVEVLARGQIANPESTTGKVEIDHEGFRAVLTKGNSKSNAWLVTGFEKRKKGNR